MDDAAAHVRGLMLGRNAAVWVVRVATTCRATCGLNMVAIIGNEIVLNPPVPALKILLFRSASCIQISAACSAE